MVIKQVQRFDFQDGDVLNFAKSVGRKGHYTVVYLHQWTTASEGGVRTIHVDPAGVRSVASVPRALRSCYGKTPCASGQVVNITAGKDKSVAAGKLASKLVTTGDISVTLFKQWGSGPHGVPSVNSILVDRVTGKVVGEVITSRKRSVGTAPLAQWKGLVNGDRTYSVYSADRSGGSASSTPLSLCKFTLKRFDFNANVLRRSVPVSNPSTHLSDDEQPSYLNVADNTVAVTGQDMVAAPTDVQTYCPLMSK